jgi:adenosylcobinamide-GDP ribazoletransferase
VFKPGVSLFRIKNWLNVFNRLKLNSPLLAISFLSRLLPGRAASAEDISASLFWYPPAGLILGLILALPFFFLQQLAFFSSGHAVFLWGLLFTVAHAWLTRALHWDGWADIFDALGSGKAGREFYAVLKDSRIGTFGALSLILGLFGMICASSLCLQAGSWPALVFAVVLGRSLVAPLAFGLKAAPESILGALLCARANLPAAVSAFCFAGLCGILCLGFARTSAALLVAAPGLVFLRRLAARQGGLNGDFMGFAIVWGELGALFTAAVL